MHPVVGCGRTRTADADGGTLRVRESMSMEVRLPINRLRSTGYGVAAAAPSFGSMKSSSPSLLTHSGHAAAVHLLHYGSLLRRGCHFTFPRNPRRSRDDVGLRASGRFGEERADLFNVNGDASVAAIAFSRLMSLAAMRLNTLVHCPSRASPDRRSIDSFCCFVSLPPLSV